MKLKEVYSKPLNEIIEILELSSMDIHTNDDGDIKAIELKYIEKKQEEPKRPNRYF